MDRMVTWWVRKLAYLSETQLLIELVSNNSVWIPFVGKYGWETVMHILGGVLVYKMFNGNSAT